jgi:23S rRNA (adenine2503-C2)-methyltransferase
MTTLKPRSLHDLSYNEVLAELAIAGMSAHHARLLWRALHREAMMDLSAVDFFIPRLQNWVNAHLGEGKAYFLDVPVLVREIRSSDGLTRKFLLRLRDGQETEAVLMGYEGRHTACVSSQAGCAMGCVFCATGQMGFVRHLRPGEIIGQVHHVRRALRDEHPGQRVRNLVMMGMGEPLHNYDSVLNALTVISDVRGPSIGPTHISISTVGVVPGILRLADEGWKYRLAVSLHGSNEAERSALVPASKKWNLAELIAACRSYCETTGRRIFFEWTLIAGVNDSPETATRLAKLLEGLPSHVNLIPLNPTGGFDGAPAVKSAGLEFQRILRAAGFPCTFRQRRGIDVAAGCGQLRAERRKSQVLGEL